eukprot:TRINITY_DN55635_c0_g1_i1.p1 TRINITY_DN55635_c0_g1~~TRINITY_DN55635_c0_g1_i1.p1  ORF type:complete len:174 (+),score=38.65 TRINITY_DN55635_c0_g1_i1:31-552(+)
MVTFEEVAEKDEVVLHEQKESPPYAREACVLDDRDDGDDEGVDDGAELAQAIGKGLAQQSAWKLEPPAAPSVAPPAAEAGRRLPRRREQLSWRQRRRQELERARSQGKVKVHFCERVTSFVVVFACLLLLSAGLRLHSSDMLRELVDWAASSPVEPENVEVYFEKCTDDTCDL